MKDKLKVEKLIAELKIQATTSRELKIIEEREKKLNEEFPKVEIIDEKHQKFNGHIYTRATLGHYFYTEPIHRAVYEFYNGCVVSSEKYDIHHKDLDKSNNGISNLQLLTKSEHGRIHRLIDKKNFTGICANCGKEFKSRNKSTKFCSKECRRNTKFSHYYEERICKVCGKKFNVRKDSKTTCCSVECASYSSCMKLSYDDVRYIRKNYKPGDREFGVVALAKKFNVGVMTISRVVNNESYKNVK